jgi:uncharacterized surface protein with fasciclin (FAS1) repeats
LPLPQDAAAATTPGNVVQVAQNDSRFTVLVEAVQAAGLTDTLTASSAVTVFAPTNQAFSALLSELGLTKDQLLANKSLLATVLKYHVVSGQVQSSAIPQANPSIRLEVVFQDRQSR